MDSRTPIRKMRHHVARQNRANKADSTKGSMPASKGDAHAAFFWYRRKTSTSQPPDMDGTHAFRIVSDSIISSICHPPSVRHGSGDSGGSKHAQNARERAAKHAVLVPQPCRQAHSRRKETQGMTNPTRHDQKRHALARPDIPHDSMTPARRQTQRQAG